MGVACDEGGEPKAATPAKAFDAAPPPPNPAIGKKPEDVAYAPTIAGLERLMGDLRGAVTSNDEPATGLLLASLRLTDSAAWMAQTFGEKLGPILDAEYQPQRDDIGQLAQVLKDHFDQGITEIHGYRYQTAGVLSATGYQSAALSKMTTPSALYSVRLASRDGKKSFHIWSFVHDKGSFRFVGKLKAVTTKKALGGRDLNEYRLSDAKRLAAQNQ